MVAYRRMTLAGGTARAITQISAVPTSILSFVFIFPAENTMTVALVIPSKAALDPVLRVLIIADPIVSAHTIVFQFRTDSLLITKTANGISTSIENARSLGFDKVPKLVPSLPSS